MVISYPYFLRSRKSMVGSSYSICSGHQLRRKNSSLQEVEAFRLTADLITSSLASLCLMSLSRVWTFQVFQASAIVWMNSVILFTSACLMPGWVRRALHVSSQKALRQVETRCLSMGLGLTAPSVSFDNPRMPVISSVAATEQYFAPPFCGEWFLLELKIDLTSFF